MMSCVVSSLNVSRIAVCFADYFMVSYRVTVLPPTTEGLIGPVHIPTLTAKIIDFLEVSNPMSIISY